MQTVVLLITDIVWVYDQLATVLKRTGFRIVWAKTAIQAVRLANEHDPDVIICDVQTPDLQGCATVEAILQGSISARTPFIFLITENYREDNHEVIYIKVDNYEPKVFNAERLLSAMNAELEKEEFLTQFFQWKLNQLQKRIMEVLPHEFGTPLNVIMGYSEILQEDASQLSANQIAEMANAMNRAARRLCRISRNYQVFVETEITEVKKGRAKIHSYTIDPRNAIEQQALRKAQEWNRLEDLHLHVKEVSGIWMLQEHLLKIAEELLDNSFKFSKPGTPVHVWTSVSPTKYALCVTNYGRGMTPEQVADIEAYMQFERKKYEQQGLGLGLAITKRLASLYGCEFTVQSVPNGETTVCVTFPLQV